MILEKIDSPSDLKNLDYNQLLRLSVELREMIIDVVSKNGGHLASNLGVIELTIALHRIFNGDNDKIIWDVGHQGYAHKILTGRRDSFETLRKTGGISGFLKRNESFHDVFNAGHSSTSISAALGFAKCNQLSGTKGNTIAVIGDGSLTGGMAYEALNYATQSKEKIIIILNDNGMSISKNVGGLSKFLSNIRTTSKYMSIKRGAHHILDAIPTYGVNLTKSIQNIKSGIKNLVIPGMNFENLGLTYFGPINGHDINEVEKYLTFAKKAHGSVIVHVITKKGKGYVPAEKHPEKYHGVGKFDVLEGVKDSTKISFSKVFGDTMVDIAIDDEKVVCFTAAMSAGTGLSKFEKIFSNRFIDVGIAEQHAVTMASAMALEGYKPFVAIYSTFLQRAYDQIIHDVCLQNSPVVFAIDRSGIVGNDGETHHGIYDISYLIHMPNMKIFSPRNGYELRCMLKYLSKNNNGPAAVRYPRGGTDINKNLCESDICSPEILRKGSDGIVIACGNISNNALKAIDGLIEKGIRLTLINPRVLKPLNIDFYKDTLKNFKKLAIVEENSIIGGFGDYFSNFVDDDIKILKLGIDDAIIPHGDVDDLISMAKLDSKSLMESFYDFFKEK